MLQIASKAWLELKRLADSIPDAAVEKHGTIGTWSGRDVLSHIAGWEAIGIDVIEQLEQTGEFEEPDLSDETIDAFNEELLIPYRAMTTPEVRRAIEDTHDALMSIAERALHTKVPAVLIDITRDHYNKHLDDLRGVTR